MLLALCEERNAAKFQERPGERTKKTTSVKPTLLTDDPHQLHPTFAHCVSVEVGLLFQRRGARPFLGNGGFWLKDREICYGRIFPLVY